MTIYDIFFFIFSLIYLPYLVVKGKANKDFAQRFGMLPSAFKGIAASRPVWIHAVSVGEVLCVKDFVGELSKQFPERNLVLSTTTKTGSDIARKILDPGVLKFYFPVDFSFVVRHVVNVINPSILIIMETEIWPNLILELAKRKIPVVLVNGRISQKSFKGYNKIKFIFGGILKKINLLCMQTSADADRIKALGARAEAVSVTGNMKFDIKTTPDFRGMESGTQTSEAWKRYPLIMAGSTHAGEEEIILDAYKELKKRFNNARLLIAPRHIDRAPGIKKLADEKGFEAVLLSQQKNGLQDTLSEDRVFILDTLGELGKLYALATVVFMGGSLIKRGGHNIIEPAMFAKPIIFGPNMLNFKYMAKLFLENDAALEVKDKDTLAKAIGKLLEDGNRRNALGHNAKSLIDKNKGATGRNIRKIGQFLEGRAT